MKINQFNYWFHLVFSAFCLKKQLLRMIHQTGGETDQENRQMKSNCILASGETTTDSKLYIIN